MSPWLIAIPVVGGIAYLILSGTAQAAVANIYRTLPTTKALTDGGERAQLFLNRLEDANLAYTAVAIWGGETEKIARTTLYASLDVVGGMAKTDYAERNITQNDLNSILSRIGAIKASTASAE